MSFLTWHREVVDPVVPILGSVQGQVGWGFGQSSLAEGVPSGQERGGLLLWAAALPRAAAAGRRRAAPHHPLQRFSGNGNLSAGEAKASISDILTRTPETGKAVIAE